MKQQTAFLIDGDNKNWTLSEMSIIGADTLNAIPLRGEALADRHARVEKKDSGYMIRDLRSETGTYVNGARIQEAWLSDGDVVRVGDQELTFCAEPIKTENGIGLKSKNESWNQTLQSLGNVARTEFPILLLGPSGTGKEVLAEALHSHSSRSMGPFVRVNCSALTETLIESELFGHIKGSFTGAIADRKGAFEAARGGTLFLDEIGDLPYGLQAKLLRALENNEIRPVGADRTVKTDVRIIAATHQNLNDQIQSGAFRNDLYYRLSVINVTPPSLKDRMEDFEELLYCFARTMRVRFSFNAIQSLKRHSWPGNIRELRNTVARASAYFPKQTILESHLPQILDGIALRQAQPYAGAAPVSMPGELPVIKEIEKQMILKRLAANQGNQRRTANDLGMPKSTLHDRLRLYQIDPRQFQKGGVHAD